MERVGRLCPCDSLGGGVEGGRSATGGDEIEGVGAVGEGDRGRAEIGCRIVGLVDSLDEGGAYIIENPDVGHGIAVGGEVFGGGLPVAGAGEGDLLDALLLVAGGDELR